LIKEINMHDGCSQCFDNGMQVVDKIRMMGFNNTSLGVPLEIKCTNCDITFEMETMECICPECRMVFGVTPCHSHSAEFVLPAGIDY
jgi:hypothetical protein